MLGEERNFHLTTLCRGDELRDMPIDAPIDTNKARAALISFLADADGRKYESWQRNRDDQIDPFAKMIQSWHTMTEAFQIPPFADESTVFRMLPRF